METEWETLYMCPHTFKFRTHPLTGTTSGIASDSIDGRRTQNGNLYKRVHIHSSFGHTHSWAHPLAWPVTLSAAGVLNKRETLFTCPYTFKFRTRLLMGTASGMATAGLLYRIVLLKIRKGHLYFCLNSLCRFVKLIAIIICKINVELLFFSVEYVVWFVDAMTAVALIVSL